MYLRKHSNKGVTLAYVMHFNLHPQSKSSPKLLHCIALITADIIAKILL